MKLLFGPLFKYFAAATLLACCVNPSTVLASSRLSKTAQTIVTNDIHCPTALPLDDNAAQGVMAALPSSMQRMYGKHHARFQVTLSASLSELDLISDSANRVRWEQAVSACGKTVANRSWIVYLRFRLSIVSASMSGGMLWFARTKHGWRAWLGR